MYFVRTLAKVLYFVRVRKKLKKIKKNAGKMFKKTKSFLIINNFYKTESLLNTSLVFNFTRIKKNSFDTSEFDSNVFSSYQSEKYKQI